LQPLRGGLRVRRAACLVYDDEILSATTKSGGVGRPGYTAKRVGGCAPNRAAHFIGAAAVAAPALVDGTRIAS
jgi:hypothetical protein